MSTAMLGAPGVVVARSVTIELCDALDLPLLAEARPGADLHAGAAAGLPLPPPGRLLRAADGWVHPGPPTAWEAFTGMAIALGAAPPTTPGDLPDVRALSAEALDAEAGDWRLPAVAVRAAALAPRAVPVTDRHAANDASVIVLGTAWAVPLAGLVLARLGARVVRVENPRREDPFVLRDALGRAQTRVALDLDVAADRDEFVRRLESADLIVDGNTPRVLANIGLHDDALRLINPHLSVVRLAAFAYEDRPGYGLAAECRGGWAARTDPPRLARTSVADPVGGLLLALESVDALARPGARARVSLEDAVAHLLARSVDPAHRRNG